jgi:hypothetical protein
MRLCYSAISYARFSSNGDGRDRRWSTGRATAELAMIYSQVTLIALTHGGRTQPWDDGCVGLNVQVLAVISRECRR